MNLIRFELQRLARSIGGILFLSILAVAPLIFLPLEEYRIFLEKGLIFLLPVLWIGICCNSVGEDHEQLALLTGMPLSLRRIFWTRFLLRTVPPVILTLVLWIVVGFPWKYVPASDPVLAVKYGAGALAAVGLLFFLAMSKLIDNFPVGKGFVVIIALFGQFGMVSLQWKQATCLPFVFSCVLAFAIFMTGSWEIWQSMCLNRKLRWRIVLLFLLPLLLNSCIATAQSVAQYEMSGMWHHSEEEGR